MANAAELMLLLKGDTKNLDGALEGAGGKLGKLGGAATGFSKLVGGVGLGAAAGLVAFSAKAIATASDIGESQNKVNVVFGDSAKVIDQLAATSATSLGQTRAEVLDAAGTLGNLMVSAGTAKDAAAGMSTGMLTLAADLGSFNNASSAEVLDAMKAGLIGSSEPMLKFGVNLMDASLAQYAMKEGLIESESEFGAYKKEIGNAGLMQLRYNAMLAQSQTAQGDFANTSDGMANSMKTIKSGLQDAVGEIGAGLLPAVEKAAGSFKDFITSSKFEELKQKIIDGFAVIGEKLSKVDFAAIADSVMGVVEKIGGVFTFLGEHPGIAKFLGVGALVVAAIAPIAAIIGPLLPIVGALGSVIGAVAGALPLLGAALAVITGPVGLVVAAVVGLIAIGVLLYKNWDEIKAKLAELGEFIAAKWDEIKAWIGEKVGAIIADVQAKWEEMKTAVQTKLTEIWTAVSTKWEEIKTTITTKLSEIWEAIRLKWDAFLREISEKLEAILGAVARKWDEIKTAIAGKLGEIWTALTTKAGEFVSILGTAWSNIQTAVVTWWNTITGNIAGAVGAVVTSITNMGTEVVRLAGQAWTDICSGVATAWQGIQAAVGTAVGKVATEITTKAGEWLTAVTGAIGDIITGIGNTVSDWTTAGGNLVAGMKKGISDAFSDFVGWFKKLFPNIIDIAKQILGIGSPSRVFMELGSWTAEGYFQGFQMRFGKDARQMVTLLGKWIAIFGEEISGGGKAIDLNKLPSWAAWKLPIWMLRGKAPPGSEKKAGLKDTEVLPPMTKGPLPESGQVVPDYEIYEPPRTGWDIGGLGWKGIKPHPGAPGNPPFPGQGGGAGATSMIAEGELELTGRPVISITFGRRELEIMADELVAIIEAKLKLSSSAGTV